MLVIHLFGFYLNFVCVSPSPVGNLVQSLGVHARETEMSLDKMHSFAAGHLCRRGGGSMFRRKRRSLGLT